jgi:hypothetical protein
LIIDDLHEITDTPAERALETFRRAPRINTSRSLVSGELMQLDGEDLRYRS